MHSVLLFPNNNNISKCLHAKPSHKERKQETQGAQGGQQIQIRKTKAKQRKRAEKEKKKKRLND